MVGVLAGALVTGALNFLCGLAVIELSGTRLSLLLPLVVCLVLLAAILWIGRALRRRGRWPAFLPAALVGWGMAALVEGLCIAVLLGLPE